MESSLANDHGSDSTRSLVLFVIISLISYNFIYIIYKRERKGGGRKKIIVQALLVASKLAIDS